MDEMIDKALEKIFADWKKIDKKDYEIKRVFVADDFENISAFEVDGEIVIINAYPKIFNFINIYDAQMQEIANTVKGKDWKKVSTINPIKFGFLKKQNTKVFLSVFEALSIRDKVSVQIFFKKNNVAIGFLTAVRREEGDDAMLKVNQNKTVKEIYSIIKNL